MTHMPLIEAVRNCAVLRDTIWVQLHRVSAAAALDLVVDQVAA
jgi:hypothetical protein